ncbi:MAG: hypothetical protein JWL60_393, partial [Gemmatimonadetes bacterium]|nr:hypothetical protein [Gemmatimonadota bacterium]
MTAAREPGFTGFGPGAPAFLRALDRHNERAWFEANRARYERELRAPLVALVNELDVRLAAIAPEIVGDPRRSLFRIHRDVRFSSDKRPYKTSVAAWFFHEGAGHGVGSATVAHGGAGFYVEVGLDGCTAGGGIWMPPRPTLARLREAIDEDHEPLAALLADPSVRRRYGTLAPEAVLRRMPRGYPDAHPAAALLRHRSFNRRPPLPERDLPSPP